MMKNFTSILCKMLDSLSANGFVAALIRQNQHKLKNAEKPLDKSAKKM